MYSDTSQISSDASSKSDRDLLSTKVKELWSLATSENPSSEELIDRLESLASALIDLKKKLDPPSRLQPVEQHGVEKPVEIATNIIDSTNNGITGTRYNCQLLAKRILVPIGNELFDCDETNSLFDALVKKLLETPNYSEKLIGSLAHCLSLLSYKHAMTRSQARDVILKLIPIAIMAFNEQTSHLSLEGRYELVENSSFEFKALLLVHNPHPDFNYQGLIERIYLLVLYSGLDEYHEYAKSVIHHAESNGHVGTDVIVVMHVLMNLYRKRTDQDKFGHVFLDEISQTMVRLMCFARCPVRGYLASLLWDVIDILDPYCEIVERHNIMVTLLDQFLAKDDDPMADRYIVQLLDENLCCVDFKSILAGKERAILAKFDKLGRGPELRDRFSDYPLEPYDEVA